MQLTSKCGSAKIAQHTRDHGLGQNAHLLAEMNEARDRANPAGVMLPILASFLVAALLFAAWYIGGLG